jgi:tetratricopeptide (TPR) repeat protein
MDADIEFDLAAQRHEVGDVVGAIEGYTRAIAGSPWFARAYFCRGIAWLELGLPSRALADLDHVLRMNPRDAEAHHMRGLAHRASGDLDGAVADATQALRVRPIYPDAYLARATARLERGELEAAFGDAALALETAGREWAGAARARSMVAELRAILVSR